MSIEERLEQEIWETLKQLKNDYILMTQDGDLIYEVKQRDDKPYYPSIDNQVKIIEKLASIGILKIRDKNYWSAQPSHLNNRVWKDFGFKPKGFILDLNEKEFNKKFSEYNSKYGIKDEQNKQNFYITKVGDDFFYNGNILKSKNTIYYKIFSSLFSLVPKGGKVTYDDLITEIKSRIKNTKGYTKDRMRSLISNNLTNRNDGFLPYANVPETEDGGLPLISTERGVGIIFNNQKG